MSKKSRALSNKKTKYYELLQNMPCVDKGAIFYWDKKDTVRGSISQGCLKLCWTPTGGCYSGFCADTFVLHADARGNKDWFRRIYRNDK